MTDQSTDPKTTGLTGLDAAQAHLVQVLGPEGWRIRRKRNKLEARWRWYRISLKYRPSHPDAPWRARMRDSGTSVLVQRGADPLEVLRGVVARAAESARFCEGRLGLARNPSKSYLAHRLLQAVGPR
jgi:hypothetical protein